MLGKLLKYDIKNMGRILLGEYLIVAVLVLTGGLIKFLAEQFPNNIVLVFLQPITYVIFVIGIFILLLSVIVISLLYYRSNLLKDEGYLMNTLPVPARNLVISKLLSTCIWMLLSIGVSYLYYGIGTLNIGWIQKLTTEISLTIGNDKMLVFNVAICIYLAIAFVMAMSQIFAALCIGYRFSENRDIYAVAAYVIFYIAGQLVVAAAMVGIMLQEFGSLSTMAAVPDTPFDFLIKIFVYCSVIEGTLVVVYTCISVNSIKKHLNLE